MRSCPECGRQCRPDARFCDACGALLEAEPAHERRKPATLLFCDMSGSTAMGERVDAETVRRLMFRYFHEMRGAIERHGGTVEKFVGDAVMAVFGVPVAHEDDALRAVRAASEMQERLVALNEELEARFGTTIFLRIGVNTGEVIAGDASSRETFVSGDAVNVAARLEQAAAAGEVLLGADTYRLVRDAVSAERVEPLSVKGKSAPLAAFKLVEVAKAAPPRRLDRPMVGRRDELALLLSAFEEARSKRRCRLVTILGEAGVGKSRLVAALDTELRGRADVLGGRCLSYGEGITFWAVGEIVRAAAGVLDEDSGEEARQKIAELAAGEERSDLVAERVSQAIGLTGGQAGAEEIAWAIRRFLVALARHSPVVVLVDDIQWAEEALLDLLASLPDGVQDAPLLVVCLTRPELLGRRPDWQVTIRLRPLAADESDQLLEGLLGDRADEDVREQLARASGGNPLFVEELAAMLRDGELGAIPLTLDALLAERLDRLSAEERAAIERGSIEGELFHRGAVAELSPPEARSRLQSALEELAARDLIRPAQATFGEDAAFRFKHLLVRDAAYRTLAKSLRAELHEAFADWLQAVAGKRIGEFEEIVGYHLEQAHRYLAELGPVDDHGRQLAARGSALLAGAGRRALDRQDVPAATTLLDRAVELSPSDRPRPTLLMDLGEARGWVGDYERAKAAFRDAASAASAQGDAALALQAHLEAFDLDFLRRERFDRADAKAACEHFAAEFARLGDRRGLGRTWFLVGALACMELRLTEADDAFSRAVENAKATGDRARETMAQAWRLGTLLNGSTPVPEALAIARQAQAESQPGLFEEAALGDVIALLAALQGNFAQARNTIARSITISQELGMRNPEANSRGCSSEIERLAGDAHEAERQRRLAKKTHHQLGKSQSQAYDAAELGRILLTLGRLAEAEEAVDECERLEPTNDDLALAQSVRGQIHARTARVESGLLLAREALRLVEETELLSLRADLTFALADVLALAGRRDEAAAETEKALELYERKGHAPGAANAQRLLAELASTSPL